MPSHASARALTLLLAATLITWSLAQPARAQLVPDRFASFSPDVSYAGDVPSPASFLGYELGEAYTPHYRVVAYLQTLADASDRVTMHRYGATHEGRPLYYLVVTSSANHARLEEIRTANLRLADPDALGDAEAEALVASQPTISWLSYNVHGNEGSSTEAAMQVAYRLAAGTDAETQRILDESVVLLDPCINPDGRDRYVWWYQSVYSRQLNDQAVDLEHDEPWPGGRTNHYWFDLNRDWVWLVHPESQGRIAAYQRWMPQMHVDYHEQGYNNNYFTMPGTTPRNLNLPDDYDLWADRYGRANAAAFDARRISYFTRESFDFFYPGYGSSYPSIMGAIGMLTEQGGHSRGGRIVETEDGYKLTLRQRIYDHYTTSIAALRTSVEHRAELLRYFRNAFTQETNKSNVAAYLLPDDPSNHTYRVVDLLLKHGVRVERAEEAFTVRQAYTYWDGTAAARTFPAGTFLIPADQPRHLFVHTVFQRQMAIEDSVMYDMATWSIPLAYNLDAAWTTAAPAVRSTPVAEAPEAPAGLASAPERPYAYVVDWKQARAPNALAMLWEAGYKVRSVQRPFGDGTRTFSEGSLVVLMGRNEGKTDSAAADMARIAREAGVEIVGMASGRMAEGVDLASPHSRPVEKPHVALLVDSPFSSYTAGQIWFLFDQWTGLGISRVRSGALPGLDLSEIDVLVLPGAYNLAGVLDSTQVERLGDWVRAGGTLVATEGAALALTRERMGLTPVELVEDPSEEESEAGEDQDRLKPSYYTTYRAREDSTGLRRIPGSAFKGHLDPTHPLAFGMPDRLYTLRFSTDALAPDDRLQTVGYYDKAPEQLLASGYASKENLAKLAGGAFAAVQPMGRGRVVFLVDNTQYRMFWVGPARLMQNAVMLLPGM